jgi:hypothetical protein
MDSIPADVRPRSTVTAAGGAKILAVMQPYLFPYIGYFQLLAAADLFVTLDDVTYIKQGWINRNRLLQQGKAAWFTVPVSGAGSHVSIGDVPVDRVRYAHWRRKFLQSVRHGYACAPFYSALMDVVDRVLPSVQPPDMRMSVIATESLLAVMDYLGIRVRVTASSAVPNPAGLGGVERVLSLCTHFGTTHYVNAPGGIALYDRDLFRQRGVELGFLQTDETALAAGRSPDGGQLSMLHLLMHRSPSDLRELLQQRTIA